MKSKTSVESFGILVNEHYKNYFTV